MFGKKKEKEKTVEPPANSNTSSVTMECATELASIFGGYAYNIHTTVSFKPGDFTKEDAEIMEKVTGIIVGAKKRIAQTYEKNGEGYRQMFIEAESALSNLRRLIASGALSGKAITALGTDIQQIDRALNTIRIYDNGKRLTRASFQKV